MSKIGLQMTPNTSFGGSRTNDFVFVCCWGLGPVFAYENNTSDGSETE